MKICAVICEFNPFHNGHKYLLEQARKQSGCDAVVCVMSGNFVQRGEPAIIDKSARVKSALLNGADCIIELPVLYATANAECFAYGGINIIKRLNGVTHLAFGCEDASIDVIMKLAELRADESPSFKENLKKLLGDGTSYPVAHSKATIKEAEKYGISSIMTDRILKKPNNLLAIEYCKQLLKQGCNVTPLPVQRVGAEHNDIILHNGYSSATSIRDKIYGKKIEETRSTLPADSFNYLTEAIKTNHLPNINLFKELILYSLRTKNVDSLYDSGEGIEIKLKKSALKANSLDEAIELTKSKRYTRVRLNRLCIQSLLDITKQSLLSDQTVPVRLLGIKTSLKKEISNICDSFIIKNSDLNNIAKIRPEYAKAEETAAAVYSQITNSPNSMYNSKLIEIK